MKLLAALLALTLTSGCAYFQRTEIAQVGKGLDTPTRSYAQAVVTHRAMVYVFTDLTDNLLIPPNEAAAAHKALTATGNFLLSFRAVDDGLPDTELQQGLLKRANTELDKATGMLGPIEAARDKPVFIPPPPRGPRTQ